MMKSQSSLEYLMTYGFAIIIIAVVGYELYSIGAFDGIIIKTKTITGLDDFYILDASITETGNLSIYLSSLSQNYFIVLDVDYNVTGYNCNNSKDDDDFSINKHSIMYNFSTDSNCNILQDYVHLDVEIEFLSQYGVLKTNTGNMGLLVSK